MLLRLSFEDVVVRGLNHHSNGRSRITLGSEATAIANWSSNQRERLASESRERRDYSGNGIAWLPRLLKTEKRGFIK